MEMTYSSTAHDFKGRGLAQDSRFHTNGKQAETDRERHTKRDTERGREGRRDCEEKTSGVTNICATTMNRKISLDKLPLSFQFVQVGKFKQ